MRAPRLEASLAVALMTEQATPSAAWVHVLPVGTFYGRDGRGPSTIAHAEAIIDATRALAGKRQLVIDYEHQTLRSEKNGAPAPAAGWISGLKQRPNGIWALVEWTEAAAVHIAKREYRYLSPVFYHTPDGVVTAILNAALTNAPNLDRRPGRGAPRRWATTKRSRVVAASRVPVPVPPDPVGSRPVAAFPEGYPRLRSERRGVSATVPATAARPVAGRARRRSRRGGR